MAAAVAFAPSATKAVVARKSFSGAAVTPVSRAQPVCRVSKRVAASAEKKQPLEALPAGVLAGLTAMMASPLYAEAGMTPSLKNLLGSVAAGGAVLAAIFFAVSAVSSFDPVARGRK